MLYARVVPVLRTPLGVEQFDYRVPESLTIRVGDLVVVPFRKRPVPALVTELMQESRFAERAVSILNKYADLWFPQSFIDLLCSTAARTFCSQPTVLNAWLRNLPKRPEPHLTSPSKGEGSDRAGQISLLAKEGLREVWLADPEPAMLRRIRECLAQGERVLVLTPWVTRVKRYQTALDGSAILHGGLNDGDAFRAWTTFLSSQTNCLIATRLGAWLAPLADRVILDEPENDDHKQDELAPRYDARFITSWCAEHAHPKVESFGITPLLSSGDEAPTIPVPLTIHVRHPQGRSTIPMVQADTLNLLREHTGPRVIVHPIRGVAARLICRDCGWRATCEHCGFGLSAEVDQAQCRQCGRKAPLPEICPSCSGADLGKSLPGIERLKAAWAKHEAEIEVEWRDLSNEAMDTQLPTGAMVAVTDGSLLGGVSEDVRRRERQCIAYRRLAARVAAAQGTLVIQCEESAAADWTTWLTKDGLKHFQDDEREQRKLFAYPPAIRLVKALVTGTEEIASRWLDQAREIFKTDVTFRGPFPVAHRAKSRSARYVCHVIVDPKMNEQELIERLAPLAKSAILDLDPIAFFR